ncbi:MAG: hypothetical protein Q4G64_09150 [bacterium]|nr:hypothetical protein [bacterium]
MTAYTVMPLRYSNNVPAMVEFLTTLGLTRHVTTLGDGFAELSAAAGRVMVHAAHSADASAATAGDTVICFSTPSADHAVEHLDTAGLDTTIWDESYGRQAMVTTPRGEAVWINEEQEDLYGYQGPEAAQPDPRLIVSAILPSPDFGSDRAFYSHFGLTPDPGASEWWEGLRGPGGVVGLHMPEPGWTPALEFEDPRYRYPLIMLGFQTAEPLEDLRDRLLAAGYEARIVSVPEATKVHVTDPDGQEIEIHPLP